MGKPNRMKQRQVNYKGFAAYGENVSGPHGDGPIVAPNPPISTPNHGHIQHPK